MHNAVINKMPADAELDSGVVLLAPLVLDPDTETGEEPTVGDGAGALLPFIARASEARVAKPTDAG